MSKRLEGKIAVVTGGNSGIGFATAKRFLEEGAFVYITGRRQAELDSAVSKLGPGAVGVQGDVSKTADLDRLFSQIEKEKGRLDIVFANAGAGNFAKLGEITEEQFDKEFSTNVKGLLFTVQKALPLLSPGSSIVLNASIAASKGMESFSVYSATKAAVRSFARTWTSDLKGKNIRVNAVSPGVVVTPAYDYLLGKENIQGFTEMMTTQIPLGRVGKEEEIANAVVFLASDEASFITGIELTVDGGMSQI
jgi:NAD(P)-dependent dehydrogenase (short-subunit alcohol dehydrogenase family)